MGPKGRRCPSAKPRASSCAQLTNGLASATIWSASSSVMKLWKTKARGFQDTGSTLFVEVVGVARQENVRTPCEQRGT